MPLGAGAAAGEEGEGVVVCGGFWEWKGSLEDDVGFPVWSVEFAVFIFEESAFLFAGVGGFGPLDAAVFVEVLIAFDAGDVTGLAGADFLEKFEGGLG